MNKQNLKRKGIRENEKGAAMVMVLLISFLLLTASAGLILETSMNSQNVTDLVAEQQAYHAAESGIQTAVRLFRCQNNENPGCDDVRSTPLINASASPNPATHPDNQINYKKAVNPVTSNTTGQSTDPARLSRWINYNSTCVNAGTSLPCVLIQQGYAFSLQVSDPDNTSRFVSFSVDGKLYDNDGTSQTQITYNRDSAGVVTPDNWLRISYIAPPAIENYDMTGGDLITNYGTFSLTLGPNGGQIVPTNNRFEIRVRMSRPYNAVKTVRGWIRATADSSEIPSIIFDSQSHTLVGSAITLNLNDTPSTGWTRIETFPPIDSPPATYMVGYQARPAAGNNVIGGLITPPEPVRVLIKSTGYGPRGARKQLEAIIQKNFFNGLTAPAALTLVGPHRTVNPESHFHFNLGQSAVLQYSGQDQASTDMIPPIGTSNPTSLECIENFLLRAPIDPLGECRDSYPNPNNSPPFNGTVQGTPSDVSTELPYWLDNPAALDSTIKQLAAVARSSNRFFPSGTTPTSWGDYASGTGITFCDGDVTLGQGISGNGGGILVVTGQLNLRGSFAFKGLIIVTGKEGLERSGGGTAEITGNVIVAPYVNSKIVDRLPNIDDPPGIYLAPRYLMDGGGGSNLQFNSQSLASGLTAVSNFVIGVVEK